MTSKRPGTLLALAVLAAALAPTVAFGGGNGARGRWYGSDISGHRDDTASNGGGAGVRAAGNHTVTLEDLAFHPGTLNISRGDSVTWVWRDGENEHNVTFHGFRSRTQTQGSYSVRFTHSGTFAYECTLHVAEGMRGKIVVH